MQVSDIEAQRIFGSEGMFMFTKNTRDIVRIKYNLFLSYRASPQNSKAITSTMQCFEKFILSFGLARYANLATVKNHWTVLDAMDSDIINFCIWKSMNGSGRTFVHEINCPLLRESKMNYDCP